MWNSSDLKKQATSKAPATLRAYHNDLAYFSDWAKVTEQIWDWPVAVEIIAKFITDHLCGLEPVVEQRLIELERKYRPGSHRFATVRRRISSLSIAHQGKKLPNPCDTPQIRKLLQKYREAEERSEKKRALTLDLLCRLLDTCNDENDMLDLRDRALMLTGFISGRRRSELVAMHWKYLSRSPDGYTYFVKKSKNKQQGLWVVLPIFGRAGQALMQWLTKANITSGYLFRPLTKGRTLRPPASDNYGLSPYTVARIVKRRAAMAGFDPKKFGAQSLRNGFIAEAELQGKALEGCLVI